MLTLARLHYATLGQLVYWAQVQQPTVSKALSRLEDEGLVGVVRVERPAIYYPTFRGLRVAGCAGLRAPRANVWSVMAHRCYRNEAEMRLRGHFPTFLFSQRQALYALGLNPARGEHGGIERCGALHCVLLDDDFMPSARITHAWQRVHRPNTRHVDLTTSRVQRWSTVASKLVVAVVDEHQYQRHKRYCERSELSVSLLRLARLWR